MYEYTCVCVFSFSFHRVRSEKVFSDEKRTRFYDYYYFFSLLDPNNTYSTSLRSPPTNTLLVSESTFTRISPVQYLYVKYNIIKNARDVFRYRSSWIRRVCVCNRVFEDGAMWHRLLCRLCRRNFFFLFFITHDVCTRSLWCCSQPRLLTLVVTSGKQKALPRQKIK